MLLSEENLVRFCLINKNGQPYEVIDAAIADEVINNHDIIIMAGSRGFMRAAFIERMIKDYIFKIT